MARAGVVRDGLRGDGHVTADEGEGCGPGEVVLQRLRTHLIGGAFAEGVLHDPEGGVGLAEARAELGDLGDGDAAVVHGEDRLALLDLLRDLRDRR